MEPNITGRLFEFDDANELANSMLRDYPDTASVIESMSKHPTVLAQPHMAVAGLARILEIYKN